MELWIWQSLSLYSLLHKDKSQKGRKELNVSSNPDHLVLATPSLRVLFRLIDRFFFLQNNV